MKIMYQPLILLENSFKNSIMYNARTNWQQKVKRKKKNWWWPQFLLDHIYALNSHCKSSVGKD